MKWADQQDADIHHICVGRPGHKEAAQRLDPGWDPALFLM